MAICRVRRSESGEVNARAIAYRYERSLPLIISLPQIIRYVFARRSMVNVGEASWRTAGIVWRAFRNENLRRTESIMIP